MKIEKAVKTIKEIAEKSRSTTDYRDLYSLCIVLIKTNEKLATEYLIWLSDEIFDRLGELSAKDIDEIRELNILHRQVVFLGAKSSFHLYLLAIEWEREGKSKFYIPRMKVLRKVVNALQRLHDDPKLKKLCISLPPGTGKTTLAIFYLTWLAGKYPDEPSLTGSHSNAFVGEVYAECLRITDLESEYTWHEIFPDVERCGTNAKEYRIDFGKPKRFQTLEFTSIGSGNAGLYRASRLLYCDDLVSGIEVALNREQLDKLWGKYTDDLTQRMIGDHCKELHIATRWSVHDVIGRLESVFGDSDEAEFIVIPALNEKDESNFDYQYGVGFTTEYFRNRRELMNGDPSWLAIYQNEPIEREGQLYHPDEINRYFDLPDKEPDAILAVCDTKDAGADFCFCPLAYQYGDKYYFEDMICDDGDEGLIEQRIANMFLKYNPHMAQFESNSAGGVIARNIQQLVKAKGGRTSIVSKYTTAHKETKIQVNAPWVKEHCYFKDDSLIKYNKDYKMALKFMFSYTLIGKNKHDDVPDGLAMFSIYAQSLNSNKVEILDRRNFF